MRAVKGFIVLLLFLSTSALAGNLTVPGDYPTIQAAVNAAMAGDTITVGSGEFDGAVIDKRVTIVGEPGAIIVGANYKGTRAFGIVNAGADGSSIRNLTFIGGDFYYGVFGWRADDVTVKDCIFLDTWHAIDNRYGNRWVITNNVVDGFIPYPPNPKPDQENHQEAILIYAPAEDNYIANNWIRHEALRNPTYSRELNFGIALLSSSGNYVLRNNVVMGNEVEIVVPDAEYSVGVGLIAQGDSSAVYGNVISDNDLKRSITPIYLSPTPLKKTNVVLQNLIR